MQTKFCPKCGKQSTEDARFCIHCGSKIPIIEMQETNEIESSIETKEESTDYIISDSQSNSSKESVIEDELQSKSSKKRKKWPIGYLIFLVIILIILLWLINKKMTMQDPPPMHSLPNERPQIEKTYIPADSLDSLSLYSVSEDELSLLSPTLPQINLNPVVPPPSIETDEYYDDEPDSYDYVTPSIPSEPKPARSLQLTTEQSVRNILVSNRFIDPISSDVLSFRNNGNLLLKNGDTIAVDMEVQNLAPTSAILNYYNDNNSWDIHLDISGPTKKLSWMDNTYIAD